ncbi:MAG: hypothetical protein LBS03_10805 [Bacteroidales bacterium]|jgi:hypothetical protein|nr:hypothetical protein [Bacteroidales bacterium]
MKYPSKFFRKTVASVVFLLSMYRAVVGQDVEAIVKAPVVAANGGVAFSQIINAAAHETVQTPYSYYLTGNLNFHFFGAVNVPLSFAYSNRQFSSRASLPFNRFSIAPSYKWVKVYAGYASLQFSPYTLAGHELFGGGVELTPDNRFKFTAIYGRLKKATEEQDGVEPSYKRMGGGGKVEYAGERFEASINIFKAKDDPSSVAFRQPDSIGVLPQDNLSGGVSLNVKLTEKVRMGAEYGMSAMNRNIRHKDNRRRSVLFDAQGDVALYHAMRYNLAYASPVGNIGATYERVAPNYATSGAYYMLNDFENITANFSTAVKNINISVDGGYQHDNLQGQKNNTTSRMIFSGNLSAVLGQKWNIGANVSNVQSYVHIRDIYDQVTQTNEFQNLDTLEYTQVNLTSSVNVAYVLQSTERQRQSLSAGFMYQRAAERQEYSAYSGNNIYNGTLVYQYAHLPSKWNASASINYNYNRMPDAFTGTVGYNLSVQKTFWEAFRCAFNATYSNMTGNEGNTANIFNLRITGGYTLLKKHNFNLSLATVANSDNVRKAVQYSANLAYGYSFGITVARKDRKLTATGNF